MSVIPSKDNFPVIGETVFYEIPEAIHVLVWRPTPDGSGPPRQVHVTFGDKNAVFLVRFKGPKGLDSFIDHLTARREEVWGKR